MFLCITPLSTVFRGGPFYCWRKPEYPEKTTDLSQATNNTLSHNVASSTPRIERALTHNISDERERERERELVLTQHVAQSHIHTVVNNICLIQRSRPQNVSDQ